MVWTNLFVLALFVLSGWSVFNVFWRYDHEKKYFVLRHLLIQSAIAVTLGFLIFAFALAASGHFVPSDFEEMMYDLFFYIAIPAFFLAMIGVIGIPVKSFLVRKRR